MYKEDLALNNQRWLICHKTKPYTIYLIYIYCSNKNDLDMYLATTVCQGYKSTKHTGANDTTLLMENVN